MTKQVSILGSTGSIGLSALEVVRRYKERFQVKALASRCNVPLMLRQMEEFRPEVVAMYDPQAAEELRHAAPSGCRVVEGEEGLNEVAALSVDMVLCAIVGAVGLHPLLAAIEAGNAVAVANKEPLVMAGRYVMERVRQRRVAILPVDSEHNAIFQCLAGNTVHEVRCVHLTASGGPFYRCTPDQLRHITPAQAARHPTWDMGAKISVDSATLMNKGLEIIEAMYLFGLRCDQIEVVIHPQSTIHSLVEFLDGSVLAQLGVTDMKIPIAFALSHPERWDAPDMRLDLTALSGLTFDTPDCSAFPCLALARAAAEAGGCAPAILNAANEVAVEAFCAERISFLGIGDVVAATLDRCPTTDDYALGSVLESDRLAREYARSFINTMETQTDAS